MLVSNSFFLFTFPSSTKSANFSSGLFLFPLRVALKLDNGLKRFEILCVCWSAYPNILQNSFVSQSDLSWFGSLHFVCSDTFNINR